MVTYEEFKKQEKENIEKLLNEYKITKEIKDKPFITKNIKLVLKISLQSDFHHFKRIIFLLPVNRFPTFSL